MGSRSFWRAYNLIMVLGCVALGVAFVVLGFAFPITAIGMWIGAASCFFVAGLLGAWHLVSKDLIPDVPMMGPIGGIDALGDSAATASALDAAAAGIGGYPVQQIERWLPGQARVDRADPTGFSGALGRVVDLRLTVTLPGRTPYDVMVRETVPPAAEAVIVPGSVIGVRANPDNRHQIILGLPGR